MYDSREIAVGGAVGAVGQVYKYHGLIITTYDARHTCRKGLNSIGTRIGSNTNSIGSNLTVVVVEWMETIGTVLLL